MSLEFALIKNLDNKKVLISENEKSIKDSKDRLYVLPEENLDKFMKKRQLTYRINNHQRLFSNIIAPMLGITVAFKTKLPSYAKFAIGATITTLSYIGFKKLDKYIDKLSQEEDMKRNKVQEVTGQNIENIK